MNTWSFADAETGEFIGKVFMGPDEALKDNTPAGTIAIPGRFSRAHKVELASGEVIDLPKDSSQMQANAQALEAKQAIAELELRQLRAVRELLLDPTNAEARAILTQIDADIGTHRMQIPTDTIPRSNSV